ncbi:MAG: polyribonucleotide nucleotidyltransferase [Chloroflexi bacterium GWB2_49_20]|nr:MAG: polyribonucleotide nucleotidyltransferase [Chloroflexi bacterium GWB2_49_20]OGN80075.1 MAG: polyribonucleotide nucleotidyltransferase [Chloroflexi bacterium GWC2_49_37]OGN85637.1 MAG: polyribonucleotide nucleotidyltransferase [Chloroflexi bacterium GWD2_49_16]
MGSQEIAIETGKLAAQAGGAVTVHLNDTIIFASATMSPNTREGIDFFPLSVEYEERMYAGGKIPGSFFRRESRPSGDAILTSRLTDRPLRPLFPEGMRNDVQIIIYSLSSDGENPLDILAINAASAALMISDIPWNGPIAAIRVGRINGQFIINPTYQELEESDLDLRLAGTRDAISMVECGAKEVPEEVMVAALELGHKSIQPLIELQMKMAEEIGKSKKSVVTTNLNPDLVNKVYNRSLQPMTDLLEKTLAKSEFYAGVASLSEEIVAEFTEGGEADKVAPEVVKSAFSEAEARIIRDRILKLNKRIDGRTTTEIRPIWCEVGFSPRTHGSAIFTRGETQVLTTATLGTLGDAQLLDTLNPMKTKRYMHHYNFPPFSTGEVKPLRGQSRREIGHGALAERALEPVIPDKVDFPYTIRLVSEVMASNGSSSMASVCGSTLALMDTGVPIKAPVAGVAMGLVMQGEKYAILTDILGTEDHLGDMDFKVTGTTRGITALQMDIKVSGVSSDIMSQALEQARIARLSILDKMLAVLPAPRPDLKEHTPRITIVKIPVDKIGAIIGPGGKNIRALQEETGTKIDIEEDGTIYISSTDGVGAEIARERIESITETAQIGRIYTGKVVRLADFGAFVEILPGTDGLVHISQLDSERVNKVEDLVQMGDEITVMVIGIDPMGKIRLSRQAVLEGWTAEEAQERDKKSSGGSRPGGGGRPGGHRPGGRDNDRRGGSNNRR